VFYNTFFHKYEIIDICNIYILYIRITM